MGERSDDRDPGPAADRYLEEYLTFLEQPAQRLSFILKSPSISLEVARPGLIHRPQFLRGIFTGCSQFCAILLTLADKSRHSPGRQS